jgi:GTP-binding protein
MEEEQVSTTMDDDDEINPRFFAPTKVRRSGVRNVAIVAHVDHGKTTLVDQLLRVSLADNSSGSGGEDTGSSGTDRLLDSGDLEKERGITITSKVTRCYYHNGSTASSSSSSSSSVINVVDTPGHADFCGEVDRVLSLVDGVCLVVDAGEGAMAQTKYVLSRALRAGLKPIVVLNKVDRPDALARIHSGETESQLLDLFDALGATDDQMNYPTLYASAREGWITADPAIATKLAAANQNKSISKQDLLGSVGEDVSMKVLLNSILEVIPEPAVWSYDKTLLQAKEEDEASNSNGSGPTLTGYPGEAFAKDKFSLAAVTVGYDPYLGRTCMGRIYSGSIGLQDELIVVKRAVTTDDDDNDDNNNESVEEGKNSKKKTTASSSSSPSTSLAGMFVNRGISRTPFEDHNNSSSSSSSSAVRAYAGDIVTLAGVPDSIAVGDTVTGASHPVPYPIETPPLAPPTLSMEFGANTGPLAGKEGTVVTSSKVRDRLTQETDNNVTIHVERSMADSDRSMVFARGELQLGILIEQMRREGFELIISPPKILTKTCPDTGVTLEPYEDVTVDVDTEYAGAVVSALTGDRKGVLLEMTESGADGKTRLRLEVPSRGLLGFSNEIATATRGSAIVNHVFLEDRPHAGNMGPGVNERGKLVSSEGGKATTYALSSLSARGELFIEPGDVVYAGMVIGENAKQQHGDLEVNPVKTKDKTNIRTVAKDEKVYLAPPKRRTVEELIGYMSNDEMIEVTPKSVRLRKAELDPTKRKVASRKVKQQRDAYASK